MFGRVVSLAALGGFLFGYDLGLIGAAMLGISDAFHISDTTKEAIVGAAKLGAFFGTFIGGVCMLRWGRRKAISLQAAFFVAGPALMAAAPGPGALVAGRLLVGLGIGASAIVVPAYLAEIAPAKHRGMVVQMYEVMLTLGMLAAVLVNLGLSTLAGGAAWRWMVGLPAIPGAFLLASLVSLPESPRWLVMRGQLDAALATLHTIIASSGRADGSASGISNRRRRARQRAAMQQAVSAAVGLQEAGSAAAEDAAWLNAVPEAGRPRSAAHKELEAAEDELLLLWSSVQKEQAAGMELRQAAAAADDRRSTAGSSGAADGQVLVSTTPTAAAAVEGVVGAVRGAGNSPRHRFAVQAAPAAAFSLDDEVEEADARAGIKTTHHKQQQEQQSRSPLQQQLQQQQGVDSINGDAMSKEPDRLSSIKGVQQSGGGGSSSNGGGGGSGPNRLKALQQKLHLGGRGSAGGGGLDAEGQQQLLLDSSAVDSSSGGGQPVSSSSLQGNYPHQQQHQQQRHVGISLPQPHLQQQGLQQQQAKLHTRQVEPGQESNVFASLWAMLCDIKAVARGPERAAFGIACCLAVFDQATASTAIINYAPEVLANRMGVQDPSLAIMYPAAIALAKVVGTLIAAVTVDKYGRKPLLVWGGVGCAVFLALTGVSLAVGSVALYLAALCLFIFSFSLSWAGLYWVVVSEIFSMGAKSPATSAATSLLFLTGAVVNFVYLSLIEWMGGAAFGVFGLAAAASAVYVWACVPETKGRTLAEIQALLAPGVGGGPRGSWRGVLQQTAGQDGRYAGGEPGSPMLPLSQPHAMNGAGSGAAGDSRLVDLRQLMLTKDAAQQ